MTVRSTTATMAVGQDGRRSLLKDGLSTSLTAVIVLKVNLQTQHFFLARPGRKLLPGERQITFAHPPLGDADCVAADDGPRTVKQEGAR